MNRERRKILRRIVEELEQVQEDEQSAYDNLPDNIRDSDRGYAMEEGISQIEEARDTLNEVIGDDSGDYT